MLRVAQPHAAPVPNTAPKHLLRIVAPKFALGAPLAHAISPWPLLPMLKLQPVTHVQAASGKTIDAAYAALLVNWTNDLLTRV